MICVFLCFFLWYDLCFFVFFLWYDLCFFVFFVVWFVFFLRLKKFHQNDCGFWVYGGKGGDPL